MSQIKPKQVGQPVIKKDAMALVTGKSVFLEDLIPSDYLVVKVLRSPHANANVVSVDAKRAMQVPGIEAVYTWEDVPQERFTMAGQTYPEPSPYDRLILDRHVRYIGDPVAIVAGETNEAVDKALKLIKVEYDVLPALLDFRNAKDNDILVHPEENWKSLCPVGADNKRNLCSCGEEGEDDVDEVFKNCDIVLKDTFHVKAAQQAMMETFRTACYMDAYGRLNVFSSTQIVFHVRRIISNALGIPKSKVRAFKPRIGGGFGAKQTVVAEVFPAFVTWKTGKPSMMIFSREESQIASSPRHEMEVSVRLGAMNDGTIRAIDVYTLSNTGAYGEHGPTTVGLSGHKSIPLYSTPEAFRFRYDVVYTNVMSAGAYRGYGATQGIFAVESVVNMLAERLGRDPVELRMQNMVRQGQIMPAYYGEQTNSCNLDKCLARTAEMIGWDSKYPYRDMGNGKVRSVGIAMAMQGSGISSIDVGSAEIKLNEDGIYTLSIAAADMGTGCDTILAQMAADCMECSVDQIVVSGADTDTSPYDSGSYASSTTYVTGRAVEKACAKLREKILEVGASMLGIDAEAAGTVIDGTDCEVLKSGSASPDADAKAVPKCDANDEYETESAAYSALDADAKAVPKCDANDEYETESTAYSALDADAKAVPKDSLVDCTSNAYGDEAGANAVPSEYERLDFDGQFVTLAGTDKKVSIEDIATASMAGSNVALQAVESNTSPVSPPPFMAGAVEIELDKETGHVEILDFAAVVDCGTVINPNLARVQTEGGLVQGIGMTLFENIQYNAKGELMNNSLMQYKLPTRLDMGKLHVEFESSYEPTGPFGAKSIGEIVINTPAPAIVHAIANATGLWFTELPVTGEKIAMGLPTR